MPQEVLMKRTRFSESQIVAILRQADAGIKVKDLCREHGISEATYDNWNAKYGRWKWLIGNNRIWGQGCC